VAIWSNIHPAAVLHAGDSKPSPTSTACILRGDEQRDKRLPNLDARAGGFPGRSIHVRSSSMLYIYGLTTSYVAYVTTS
jgi:hypothetical protein